MTGVSEKEWWGIALAVSLVLAIGVEEVPKVAAPFILLLLLAMFLGWKGWSSSGLGQNG